MNSTEFNLTLRNISPDNNSSSDNEGYLRSLIILDIVSNTLLIIIFALGIIGNGLVIWIAGFRMKKTISALWFLNLAIADFFNCASLSVQIAVWAFNRSYSEIFLCVLSAILFNLNMSASIFILTAMSIDRWVSIMWPFWAKVHRTRKVVRMTVAIIWLLSLILFGLVILLFASDLDANSRVCVFGPWYNSVTDPQKSQIFKLIRLLIMFVIPFLIISITYASIFFKLRKIQTPQRSQRPYRIITAVILFFFICWSPYYIFHLIPKINSYGFHFYIASVFIFKLSYLNSCINPILYVLMRQDFRHSLLRSIPFRLGRAVPEEPNDQYEQQDD